MANTYSKYVFFAKYSVDAFRYAFANIFEYVFFTTPENRWTNNALSELYPISICL